MNIRIFGRTTPNHATIVVLERNATRLERAAKEMRNRAAQLRKADMVKSKE